MKKIILLSAVAVLILTGCFGSKKSMPENTNSTDKNKEIKEVTQAIIKTNLGDITIEFFKGEAPKTVQNFVDLASKKFYDGTRFHRVIKDFMIQGGDPNSKEDNKALWGFGTPGYKFEDEINNHKLVKGSLAMANSGPNTNGSQFFIVTAESTPWLDGKHTCFGQVVSGMEIVDKIQNVNIDSADHPINDITIQSIELK